MVWNTRETGDIYGSNLLKIYIFYFTKNFRQSRQRKRKKPGLNRKQEIENFPFFSDIFGGNFDPLSALASVFSGNEETGEGKQKIYLCI